MKELKRLEKRSKTFTNRGLEFEECIADLLKSSVVRSMEGFIQHSDVTCLNHCINVSYGSFLLCRLLGMDYRSAARGALLHDFFLYDWHVTRPMNGPHAFSHPHTALKNACDIFELNRKEKDIIVKHMWPVTMIPPRCAEALVVSLIDKCCALMETVEYRNKKRLTRYRRILLKYAQVPEMA